MGQLSLKKELERFLAFKQTAMDNIDANPSPKATKQNHARQAEDGYTQPDLEKILKQIKTRQNLAVISHAISLLGETLEFLYTLEHGSQIDPEQDQALQEFCKGQFSSTFSTAETYVRRINDLLDDTETLQIVEKEKPQNLFDFQVFQNKVAQIENDPDQQYTERADPQDIRDGITNHLESLNEIYKKIGVEKIAGAQELLVEVEKAYLDSLADSVERKAFREAVERHAGNIEMQVENIVATIESTCDLSNNVEKGGSVPMHHVCQL